MQSNPRADTAKPCLIATYFPDYKRKRPRAVLFSAPGTWELVRTSQAHCVPLTSSNRASAHLRSECKPDDAAIPGKTLSIGVFDCSHASDSRHRDAIRLIAMRI